MELLNCPFCGVAPKVYPAQDLSDFEMVQCANEECPVTAYTDHAPLQDALAAWNARVPAATELADLRIERDRAIMERDEALNQLDSANHSLDVCRRLLAEARAELAATREGG